MHRIERPALSRKEILHWYSFGSLIFRTFSFIHPFPLFIFFKKKTHGWMCSWGYMTYGSNARVGVEFSFLVSIVSWHSLILLFSARPGSARPLMSGP
ncbi:hypothetical protein BDV26DRAFT_241721 [Aspergillus bertholletiae]|uniref:Uncharacterized protein n=1 Tax=Aspergillus bertholletiae TaxID=1226010 RepID=A0A5N7B4F6_9EURO|nr:hypothetical protein BDV26DRAFT_241721 [Aspergillus bertholletiae]